MIATEFVVRLRKELFVLVIVVYVLFLPSVQSSTSPWRQDDGSQKFIQYPHAKLRWRHGKMQYNDELSLKKEGEKQNETLEQQPRRETNSDPRRRAHRKQPRRLPEKLLHLAPLEYDLNSNKWKHLEVAQSIAKVDLQSCFIPLHAAVRFQEPGAHAFMAEMLLVIGGVKNIRLARKHALMSIVIDPWGPGAIILQSVHEAQRGNCRFDGSILFEEPYPPYPFDGEDTSDEDELLDMKNKLLPAGYSFQDRDFNHNEIGIRLEKSGASKLACQAFRAAIKFDDLTHIGYMNLGVSVMRRGEFYFAHVLLMIALDLHPSDTLSLTNIKDLYGSASGYLRPSTPEQVSRLLFPSDHGEPKQMTLSRWVEVMQDTILLEINEFVDLTQTVRNAAVLWCFFIGLLLLRSHFDEDSKSKHKQSEPRRIKGSTLQRRRNKAGKRDRRKQREMKRGLYH